MNEFMNLTNAGAVTLWSATACVWYLIVKDLVTMYLDYRAEKAWKAEVAAMQDKYTAEVATPAPTPVAVAVTTTETAANG